MSDPLNEVKFKAGSESKSVGREPDKRDVDFRHAVQTMIRYVGEDPTRAGLIDTPERVRKAWTEMLWGYGENVERHFRLFDAEGWDEMVVVKNVEFVSVCEHHWLPFEGVAHVGYLPNGKVLGLSKIARIVDVFAKRMQLQERLTGEVADVLFRHEGLNPKGVGVVVEAHHSCMSCRGVKKRTASMVTSALRGAFKEDEKTRAEFLNLTVGKK